MGSFAQMVTEGHGFWRNHPSSVLSVSSVVNLLPLGMRFIARFPIEPRADA